MKVIRLTDRKPVIQAESGTPADGNATSTSADDGADVQNGTASDPFYAGIPVFRGFSRLMDPNLYRRLPDDWTIGIADIVDSTAAITDRRYRTVNTAGAAVIAAVTNALHGEEFPFVFGGDGASFAVSPSQLESAREALAATANWVRDELDLELRIGLVPIADIRAQGHDVLVARYGPSASLSYAMFSGGGLAWAEAALKRGDFAVTPARAGVHPDLSGLTCRFEEMPARRGVILSLLVEPALGASPKAFRYEIEQLISVVERSPGAGSPVSPSGLRLKWPPHGLSVEASATPGRSRRMRRAYLLGRTLYDHFVMRLGNRIHGSMPNRYRRRIVENSDFKKYDDGLRMVLDCNTHLERELTKLLESAAARGILRFGLHRQDAAMMTCFTSSAQRGDHVHFIDGARGGYASAATAMKAAAS